MRVKDRYYINNDNRLVLKHARKHIPVKGRFDIDRTNRLIYWLNEPVAWRKKYDLPQKISFEGTWSLNQNYDLELILSQPKGQLEDRLVIKGEIISADRDAFVFEIISIDEQGMSHICLLKLAGFWQEDQHNRISFIVKKKVVPDILTLEGSWQVNKNQQIIYNYEKTALKRKTKISRTITFEGFWQIDSANKLTYILARGPNSCFDFRAQLESPNLYPQEGVIKYRIGIGIKGDRRYKVRIVSLYGSWKFSRKSGLIFQIDYGEDRVQSIEFSADINLSEKDKIIFSLTNKRKDPLGISVTFTHRFLKKLDAEVFIRLTKIQQERAYRQE